MEAAVSISQGEETESRSIPGVDALRTQLSELESEREQLFAQLGRAALDEDDEQVKTLERQLDELDARRAGLSAQIAQLEAAAASDERERRRREAVERERARREQFSGAQLELYEGWSANLEHAARVVEVTQELEQLKSARPADPAELASLSQQLREAGLKLDTSYQELETSTDLERLRQAAGHYRALAQSIREGQQPREPQDQAEWVRAAAEPSDEPSGANPPKPVSTASQEGPPTPAPSPEEHVVAASGGTLRLYEEEERRLRSWRDSLERQGDPLGILGEVNRQLDEIVAKRTAVLRSADGVGGRADGS